MLRGDFCSLKSRNKEYNMDNNSKDYAVAVAMKKEQTYYMSKDKDNQNLIFDIFYAYLHETDFPVIKK